MGYLNTFITYDIVYLSWLILVFRAAAASSVDITGYFWITGLIDLIFEAL